MDLSLGQQLVIMLTLMLTSKGMAGIPRLPGHPRRHAGHIRSSLEGVILIIGVDELMDMARTTVNLVGNCLATAVMARWEGKSKLGFAADEARVPDAERSPTKQ